MLLLVGKPSYCMHLFTNKVTIGSYRWATVGSLADNNRRWKNVASYRWAIAGSLICFCLLANFHTAPIHQQSDLNNRRILLLGHRWITDINRRRKNVAIVRSLAALISFVGKPSNCYYWTTK